MVASGSELLQRYRDVRARSLKLVEHLSTEDCALQPHEDVSPLKWHLAHSTWFFDGFVSKVFADSPASFLSFDSDVLFNSYYQGVGKPFSRAQRHLLSRPSLAEVIEYRKHVDACLEEILAKNDTSECHRRVLLGLHHEMQHQELMLMDIKASLWANPLLPSYAEGAMEAAVVPALNWLGFDECEVTLGAETSKFCFDNETPAHRVRLGAFQISSRPVSCREYLKFIDDGGYERHEFWLSDGWDWVRAGSIDAPCYWMKSQDQWQQYTLLGMRPLQLDTPVVHVSYYEADAFARWSSARLPTEFEWEHAARSREWVLDSVNCLHPIWGPGGSAGQVWEWTASSYAGYPGYRPWPDQFSEYNGKFMSGQYVLRGGCCATPPGHARATYRNFYRPWQRWMYSGIRLAKDS